MGFFSESEKEEHLLKDVILPLFPRLA